MWLEYVAIDAFFIVSFITILLMVKIGIEELLLIYAFYMLMCYIHVLMI